MEKKSRNYAATAAAGAPFGAEYQEAATGEIERIALAAARPEADEPGGRDPRPLGAGASAREGSIDYLARPDLRAEAERGC